MNESNKFLDAVGNRINRVLDATAEQWLLFALTIGVMAALALAIIAAASDHKVRCHYLKTIGAEYRIMADIDWDKDIVAYWSTDAEETLGVFSGLKQCASE